MGGDTDIGMMAGHVIRRLHQHSVQVFAAHARAAGVDLTPVQFAALEAVRTEPGLDQARIAAAIAYDRATIGGVIDRLEAKGLLSRKVSATDRRARVVHLTEQGEALLQGFRPVVEAAQAEILGPLDAAERQVFLALARRALGLVGD
ncbi:MarR family transcriptional regulator [Ponticoccus gilvus]|nr:MarR family transcriptional regulator [Enemella evansiae]